MEGIIPLWKEPGMTSHDCVFRLRKILHTKKVGHTGTLDPDVAGVLPICIGRATKLAEYVTAEGKTYIADVSIGTATTTEDASGEIIAEKAVSEISAEQIEEAIHQLEGEITQVPPMYSAVKVNGRKLYEYARNGETVERPARKVQIHAIKRLDAPQSITAEAPIFTIEISCGKGTYIRTLAVMIGEILGYPAHMSALKRTRSGYFETEHCFRLAEIEAMMKAEDQHFLLPLEKGIAEMPRIEVNAAVHSEILNGKVMPEHLFAAVNNEARVAVFHEGKLVAIYKPHPEKAACWKPEKVIELRPGNLN